MRELRDWGSAIVLAVLGGAAPACTMPHMAVPPDVGPATEPIAVEGRSMSSGMLVNEEFKIGTFDVANVSRGPKSKTRFGGFGAFKSNEESGYSFDLKQGAQSLHGECVLEANESGAEVGSVTISNEKKKLGCACGNEASPAATLVMRASTADKHYSGTLKAQDASYEVKAIYDREGAISDGNPAGYRIDGQGVQGAVDVLGPGRVWLAKSLDGDKRTNVTCVVAGLLLFKPVIKH